MPWYAEPGLTSIIGAVVGGGVGVLGSVLNTKRTIKAQFELSKRTIESQSELSREGLAAQSQVSRDAMLFDKQAEVYDAAIEVLTECRDTVTYLVSRLLKAEAVSEVPRRVQHAVDLPQRLMLCADRIGVYGDWPVTQKLWVVSDLVSSFVDNVMQSLDGLEEAGIASMEEFRGVLKARLDERETAMGENHQELSHAIVDVFVAMRWHFDPGARGRIAPMPAV